MPQSIQAHPGHWDKLGLDEVIDVGNIMITRLANGKEIAETWKKSAEFNYDLSDGFIKIKGKNRWVVVYENSLENDPSKSMIRIIMTPKGKFVGYEYIETKNDGKK